MPGAGKTKTAVAIVIALALGAGAVAGGGFQLYRVWQIARGPVVEGRATEWTTSSSRGRTYHKIKYTFTRDDGATSDGWAVVPKEVQEATRGGAPVRVRTAAGRADWHVAEPALATARNGGALLFGAGVVLLALVLGTLVLPRLARRRAAQVADFPKDPPPASA